MNTLRRPQAATPNSRRNDHARSHVRTLWAATTLAIAAFLPACESSYDHVVLSSGGDTEPRLVMRGRTDVTVRHGTAARVLPLVFLENGDSVRTLDDDDIDFRFADPGVLRVDRGKDPAEFYFAGTHLGTTSVEVVYKGRSVDRLTVTVIPQQ